MIDVDALMASLGLDPSVARCARQETNLEESIDKGRGRLLEPPPYVDRDRSAADNASVNMKTTPYYPQTNVSTAPEKITLRQEGNLQERTATRLQENEPTTADRGVGQLLSSGGSDVCSDTNRLESPTASNPTVKPAAPISVVQTPTTGNGREKTHHFFRDGEPSDIIRSRVGSTEGAGPEDGNAKIDAARIALEEENAGCVEKSDVHIRHAQWQIP